ncbi:MAG: hypothetical protein LBP51_03290 [Deferribacteraceae bacterium]|jgi:hypothetical protein|nr:hypothetical protein [Deferribacteraceae bacterium]
MTTLRILTQPEVHSVSRLALGGETVIPQKDAAAIAKRISLEIDRGFRIAAECCLVDAEADRDVDIALAQDLWDAGELIKLYHAHKWLASLIGMAESFLSLCRLRDVKLIEAQAELFKKQTADLILLITQAARTGKPVIKRFLKAGAEAARSLKKFTPTSLELSKSIAETALSELRYIHYSLLYRIEDDKKFTDGRDVMRQNRLAQNSTTPAELSKLVKLFKILPQNS